LEAEKRKTKKKKKPKKNQKKRFPIQFKLWLAKLSGLKTLLSNQAPLPKPRFHKS
jgi:hypothetical protein